MSRRGRRNYGITGFEEAGGYMAAKIAKLQDQYKSSVAGKEEQRSEGIFTGVAIFVNGYTEPTGEELKRIMMTHGGIYHHYYSGSSTTHIIASNLPDTKIKNMNTDRITSPKWISDSLKAGRLLDYTKYLLYTKQSRSQPKICFKRKIDQECVEERVKREGWKGEEGRKDGWNEEGRKDGRNEEEVQGENSMGKNEEERRMDMKREDERQEENRMGKNEKEKNIDIKREIGRQEKNRMGKNEEERRKVQRIDIERKEEVQKKNRMVIKEKIDIEMKGTEDTEKCNNHKNKEPKSIESGKGCNLSPTKHHHMSTANPGFLSEFYSNSRLHHISTMGATFKEYVGELRKNKGFPGRLKLMVWLEEMERERENRESSKQWVKEMERERENRESSKQWVEWKRERGNEGYRERTEYGIDVNKISTDLDKNKTINKVNREGMEYGIDGKKISTDVDKNTSINCVNNERIIMHIDMDCFFVSVGLKKHPELRDKPVAVTHARAGSNVQAREGSDRQYELNYYKERRQKTLNARIHKMKPNINDKLDPVKLKQARDVERVEGSANIQHNRDIDEGIDMSDFEDNKFSEIYKQVGNKKQSTTFTTTTTPTTTTTTTPTTTTIPSATGDATSEYNQAKTISQVPNRLSTLSLIDDTSSMSEIASCNYEARKAGIKNGMFLGPALKLCPNLHTIPYDFEGYKEVSYKLYDIVGSLTHDIEAVSCDEMFIDLTGILNSCHIKPLHFATYLRNLVEKETGCPCSAGLGPNMLIARLATRVAKPNGQHYIQTQDLSTYIRDQKVTDLPGVGWSLGSRLESEGIVTCGDLQTRSMGQLQTLFGTRTGNSLYNYCRGIDNREIKAEHVRKSVSAEVNYGIRFTSLVDAHKFVSELAGEVENRLITAGMKGKCITLKLKIRAKDAPIETAKFMGHGVCDNLAKSISLSIPTSSADIIEREVICLLRQVKANPQDIRGIGIQVSRLDSVSSKQTGKSSIKSYLLAAKNTSKNIDKKNTANLDARNIEIHPGQSRENKTSKNIDKKNTVDSRHSIEIQPGPIKSYLLAGKNKTSKNITKKNTANLDARNIEIGTGPSRENNTSKNITKRNTSNLDTRNIEIGAGPSRDVKMNVIDLEVLEALPEEMKEQVIKEYKEQGYIIPSLNKGADEMIEINEKIIKQRLDNKQREEIKKTDEQNRKQNVNSRSGVGKEMRANTLNIPAQNIDTINITKPIHFSNTHKILSINQTKIYEETKRNNIQENINGDDIESEAHIKEKVKRNSIQENINGDDIESEAHIKEKAKRNNIHENINGDDIESEAHIKEKAKRNNIQENINDDDIESEADITNFSQVDTSFLNAIPEELQEELRHEFERQKQENINCDDVESEADITSFSQVDTSFLNAIPEELQEELRHEFERQKQEATEAIAVAAAADILSQQIKEDTVGINRRQNMPNQNASHTIIPARKRGRPPKKQPRTSPKKQPRTSPKKQPRTSPKKQSRTSPKKKTAKSPTKLNATSQEVEETKNVIIIDGGEGSECVRRCEENDENNLNICNEERPKLCGVQEISEVKLMIREWVLSCSCPEDEDAEILANYYTSFVKFGDLEQLDSLIKYLYRQVVVVENKEWMNTYNTVIERVQNTMLNIHHIKLKVNTP